MTITREQVAGLHAGDVVRLVGLFGLTIEGPLQRLPYPEAGDGLWLADQFCVRGHNGEPLGTSKPIRDSITLEVLSRAPRPLYVNHDRTEPVEGDIAREHLSDSRFTYAYRLGAWYGTHSGAPHVFQRRTLRLLVDGETGQVLR